MSKAKKNPWESSRMETAWTAGGGVRRRAQSPVPPQRRTDRPGPLPAPPPAEPSFGGGFGGGAGRGGDGQWAKQAPFWYTPENTPDFDPATAGDTLRDLKTREVAARYQNKVYPDTFTGQFAASYAGGRMGQAQAKAWNAYLNEPTEENRERAERLGRALSQFQAQNAETLADDAALPWLSQSLASYLPQLGDQLKAQLGGGVAGGLAGSAVPGIGTALGAKAGIVAAQGAEMYGVMRGAAFKSLLDLGVDEQTARAAANDEAVVSSLLEMADTGVDLLTLGGGKLLDLLGRGAVRTAAREGAGAAAESAARRILKALAGYGINVAGEAAQESAQEAVSIANERRAMAGDLASSLPRDAAGVLWNDVALGQNPENRERVLSAGAEAAKIAAMVGGGTALANYGVTGAVNGAINGPPRRANAAIDNAYDAMGRSGMFSREARDAVRQAQEQFVPDREARSGGADVETKPAPQTTLEGPAKRNDRAAREKLEAEAITQILIDDMAKMMREKARIEKAKKVEAEAITQILIDDMVKMMQEKARIEKAKKVEAEAITQILIDDMAQAMREKAKKEKLEAEAITQFLIDDLAQAMREQAGLSPASVEAAPGVRPSISESPQLGGPDPAMDIRPGMNGAGDGPVFRDQHGAVQSVREGFSQRDSTTGPLDRGLNEISHTGAAIHDTSAQMSSAAAGNQMLEERGMQPQNERIAIDGKRDYTGGATWSNPAIEGGSGAESISSKTVNDILENATPGRVTRGKTTQYVKLGTYNRAVDDFNSLNPLKVKDINTTYGIGKTGILPDGRTVTVRPGSTDGRPTVEIRGSNGRGVEIRYGE